VLPLVESFEARGQDGKSYRVFGYEQALFDFDSKHISQPGNRRASNHCLRWFHGFNFFCMWLDVWSPPRLDYGGGDDQTTRSPICTRVGI